MDFISFLDVAYQSDFWQTRHIICLEGSFYPSMWINYFFSNIVKNNVALFARYQRIFVEDFALVALKELLNQSFLGERCLFFLGNLSASKLSLQTIEYLMMYQGPHILIYFFDDIKKPSYTATKIITSILLPTSCNGNVVSALTKTRENSLDITKIAFIKKNCKQSMTNLDELHMLITYVELISLKQLVDIEPLIHKIFGKDPSLMLLSQYFFARNATALFNVWSKIHASYPVIFWLMFWMDTVWRAYFVVDHLNNGRTFEAKQIGYKLPYSFMVQDWKKFDTRELIKIYAFLYTVDYRIKTGTNFYFFDLFYNNFINGLYKELSHNEKALSL